MVSLSYAARSDVGLVRSSNQDSAYAGPNLLLVADGMGGHAGGDVASAIAVAAIEHLDTTTHDLDRAIPDLEDAIEEARLALIHASATTPQLTGLGTTVVALLRTGDSLALAHMGDSRAYLLRDGDLRQVTVDHTLVQHLVDTGRIAPEEAAHHPNRNVVMRVLSDFDVDLRADLLLFEARPGDRWLLCSDGLSGFVELPELQAILGARQSPDVTADALVEAAKRAASTDNITAIVADVVADSSAAFAAQPVETVGAAAQTGALPELVAQSIDAVRLLPRPNGPGLPDDDAIPMTAADFAAAGLTDLRGITQPPAPPTEPIPAIPDLATPPHENSATAPTGPASPTATVSASATETGTGILPPNGSASPQLVNSVVASSPFGQTATQVIDPPVTTEITQGVGLPTPVATLAQPIQYQEFAAADSTGYPQPDYEPLYDDDLAARPAPRRHPVLLTIAILGALTLLGLGTWFGYSWTQRQFYVGQSEGHVAVFQGVPTNLGPFTLHHPVVVLDTAVEQLPPFFVDRLDGTIRTDSLAEARERADRLIAEALGDASSTPMPAATTPPTVTTLTPPATSPQNATQPAPTTPTQPRTATITQPPATQSPRGTTTPGVTTP